MAFRRESLLAIGGFNPIYLRAGDDVDVCWRLQARGWKIGFASAALVWHHHRSTVKAYWRQQLGYGEGETWLMAHHPEKFLDGRMLWRGRIYSPLPFLRSLWSTRINAGVWGTAAFPAIYRTDVHPFAFLPHSIRWQILSFLLTLSGVGVAVYGGHAWASALLLVTGFIGVAVTVAKNLAYAVRSDVKSLPGSKAWYRAMVAYLHFIQPFARIRGRIRGVMAPPEVALPAAEPQTSRKPQPMLREIYRALLLMSGTVAEDRFWSETWTSSERVLSQLTDWLRRSRAVRIIEVDEGWSDDRDVSVFVGRWAWLDVRALVEEHAGGRVLLRVSTHLRPTFFGIVAAVGLGLALTVAAAAGVAWRFPFAGVTTAVLTLALTGFALWRTAQTTAILRRAVARVAAMGGMSVLKSGPARVPLIAPSVLRIYGLRSAFIFVIMLVGLGASTLMLREAATAVVIGANKGFAGDNGPAIQAWLDAPGGIGVAPNGDVFFADSNNDVIRQIDARNTVIKTVVGAHDLGTGFSGDNGLATAAQLDTPDGVAIAPDGDLIVADSHNHRIRRVDHQTGVITTIAGSGEAGYDGDDKPATEAALNTPSAVAAAPNGDIYIADTLNNRIRVIAHATGRIYTVAGTGETAENGEPIGDGGPASDAALFMPADVALAPNGDIYVADMHHNRVRKVDAKTHLITTVAGSGKWGYGGDNGPAVDAMLTPAGIAVAGDAQGKITLFIADYYNGHVRAVGPDGIIHEVSGEGQEAIGAPTRVAFSPRRGWLYVTDSSRDRIVVLNIPQASPNTAPPRPAAPPTRKAGA